jgi:N-acetylneuraminate synthase
VYITGEIGINHNGDLGNAIALIDQAVDCRV